MKPVVDAPTITIVKDGGFLGHPQPLIRRMSVEIPAIDQHSLSAETREV